MQRTRSASTNGSPAMYKILFDTNALVDFLLGREPGCGACKRIIAMCDDGQHALYAASTSVKDAYYLVRSGLKRAERAKSGTVGEAQANAISEVAWACVQQLARTFLVVPVGRSECLNALTMKALHDDFEDDLVLAAARKADVDFLVTGDQDLMRHAPVACLEPADLATLLAAEQVRQHGTVTV